jgi:hypothetical protein
MVITNLTFPRRIRSVGFLVGDLIKHGVEKEVVASVLLDQVFEFLDDGVEAFYLLRILIYLLDFPLEPLLVYAVVFG